MAATFYSNLPEKSLGDAPNLKPNPNFVEDLFKKVLPPKEAKDFEKHLHWQFLLERHALPDKKARPIRKKKSFLTRKQRRELNILKLPKTDWDYKSLESLREMWRQYMRQTLDLENKAPGCTDPDWGNFSMILARCELIGGELKVVRSQVPTLVGMAGTIVLETKMTFQIVTPDSKFKTIPKQTSVFEFMLDSLRFTVFGKHIMTKPSERSVKKIKSQMLPDL